ncbi:hypothetical protein DCC79_12085 [bacterium]|nr:hypothetical protein [Chloroflexi bacterium CFX6]RIL09061.1 MAG: hypothetical protein DCC79_12085 [bacterium]
MDNFSLPNTDSPEVMEQAISIWMTTLIWRQIARVVLDEESEARLLGIYDNIYRTVRKTHASG